MPAAIEQRSKTIIEYVTGVGEVLDAYQEERPSALSYKLPTAHFNENGIFLKADVSITCT